METIQVNGAIITDKVAETIAKLQEPGESIMTVYLRTLEELLVCYRKTWRRSGT